MPCSTYLIPPMSLPSSLPNELPADFRTAESFTSFRKQLKTHLFIVHLDST